MDNQETNQNVYKITLEVLKKYQDVDLEGSII